MLISYSDSEVKTYHPVCEKALKNALKKLKLDKVYEVKHHSMTGTLEMDFNIKNKKTGKYLCVIEVKRTPADVNSARYQFQAMSYVQMNDTENEKPFYIITNLECAYAFRYDPQRPRVFQQMLKPGLSKISDFSEDNEKAVEKKLSEYFADKLLEFIKNNYEYIVTLESFAKYMENIKNDSRKWKSYLAVLLYEYIRGAFIFVNRNELKDIRIFKNNIEDICNEAAKINFKEIFTYDSEKFTDKVNVSERDLEDIFDFGNQNVNADAISGVLHSIVSEGHEHEGEVPTDLELSRIVALLAHYYSLKTLQECKFILEPAAGSGNLATAAIKEFEVEPRQIIVNEWNERLLELLSLRIGLTYPQKISKNNSPIIFNKNIADISEDIVENVDVVIMNPPFLAGIYCEQRKTPLFNRIKELKGSESELNFGQMPLEAVFLELVCTLVKKNTIISCVFPKTHLKATGKEAQKIREMLLNTFGLKMIFTYPEDGVFSKVKKGTCILVGINKCPQESIDLISSYSNISDIDINKLYSSLENIEEGDFMPIMPGIQGKKTNSIIFKEKIARGWVSIDSEMKDAVDLVNDMFSQNKKFISIEECNMKIKRGIVGNSGGSDLLFVDSKKDIGDVVTSKNIKTGNGIRNAKLNCCYLETGDTRCLARGNKTEDLTELINAFTIIDSASKNGKQMKKTKNTADWLKIIERTAKSELNANLVLIPRGIRTKGRVYVTDKPFYVSTNFVALYNLSNRESILLVTWFSTIFYQLLCEVYSKDQEGMRKMEVNDIRMTYIPKFENVTDEEYNLLKNTIDSMEFLDLKNPEIRDVDKLWAKILFGENADIYTDTAIDNLKYVATRRNS